MYNYIKKIKNSQKSYIHFSKSKEKRQKDYLSKCLIVNSRTGENYKLDYSVKNSQHKDYVNLIQKSILIQEQAQEMGLDLALFITLTLNSQYHKYTKINDNKYIYNPKFEKNNTIEKGYKELQDKIRQIRQQLAKYGIKPKFVRVVEPHKDHTPHVHMILYISSDDKQKVIKTIQNKIQTNTNDYKITKKGKILLNHNTKENENNAIGRSEIEVLKDAKKGTGYIAKYIQKNVNEGGYYVDGWKKYNKIRMITTSNTNVPLYVVKSISNYIPKSIKQSQNLQSYLYKNINIYQYTKSLDNSVDTKEKLKNENAKYIVKIYREQNEYVSDANKDILQLQDLLDNFKNSLTNMFIFYHLGELQNKVKNIDLEYDYYDEIRKMINEYYLLKNENKELNNKLQFLIDELYNEIDKKIKITNIQIINNCTGKIIYNKQDYYFVS
ncbi:MAG: replication endonuclease [Candidatus Muiribacteriota bacterium]